MPKKSTSVAPWKVKLFCHFAYLLIKMIHWTCRHRYVAEHRVTHAKSNHPHRAVAFAFWHEHSAAGFMSQQGRKIAPMISMSKDGEIAAFVASRLGMRPVRGSSSRQGRAACDAYADLVVDGYTIALTVDGPKGPRHQTKPGIVQLACQYQVAILPFIAKADRYWTLPTWDQLKIPKPFSRITTVWGEPIEIPTELDQKQRSDFQTLINERLEELEHFGELQLFGDLTSSHAGADL